MQWWRGDAAGSAAGITDSDHKTVVAHAEDERIGGLVRAAVAHLADHAHQAAGQGDQEADLPTTGIFLDDQGCSKKLFEHTF